MSLLAGLGPIRRQGHDRELPSAGDEAVLELAEHYARSGADERQAIRSAVPEESRMLLLRRGDRLATLADRRTDLRLVQAALVLHSIEDFRFDERDNIRRLALIHHVAEKLGAEPGRLFEEAARLSSAQAARALQDFLDRPPELKSLESMAIVEELTADGVGYRFE